MDSDEKYMLEALKIAKNAYGRTSPNPMVGAIIVKDNRIIAEGWHRKAGTPHAEIHALNMAGELARGATMYVTLEPCSHQGRTAPCADALVSAGISRIVIATLDPNPLVAGRGVGILKNAGLDVKVGVLEAEAQRQNEVFFKWITTKKPFVALKTAMTLDGKIATVSGKSQWITNEKSRQRVHQLRDVYDGILVGINTVIKDNPSLTTRLLNRVGKNPVRIVLDSRGRTPLSAKIINDKQAKTIIAVSEKASVENIAGLEAKGAEIIVAGKERVDIDLLLRELGKKEITSLLVEGGGQVNFSFVEARAVDRVYAFVAPKIIGGRKALTPVEGEGFGELFDALELSAVETELLDGDIFITGAVKCLRG